MHQATAGRQNELMPDNRQFLVDLGLRLREERTRRGITLAQVADATKITVRHLNAIEEGDYSEMPAEVYMRGFVRSYTKFLDLDENEMLKSLDAAGILPHTVNVPAPRATAGGTGAREGASGGTARILANPRVLIAAGAVLAGGALLGLGVRGLWAIMKGTGEKSTAPSPFSTVPENANAPAARKSAKPRPAPVTAVAALVTVSVTAMEECWIEFQTDLKRPEEVVLKAGEFRTITGASRVRLLVGNAGGVRVSGPAGPVRMPEKPGRVVHLLFTPEGMEKLKLPGTSATPQK